MIYGLLLKKLDAIAVANGGIQEPPHHPTLLPKRLPQKLTSIQIFFNQSFSACVLHTICLSIKTLVRWVY